MIHSDQANQATTLALHIEEANEYKEAIENLKEQLENALTIEYEIAKWEQIEGSLKQAQKEL